MSITDLLDPESETISGGAIHEDNRVKDVEDEGLLFLKGSGSVPIEVSISPVNLDDVTYDIRYFIKESEEPSLRLWVVSNWKFGAILPGGILLFCLAIFFWLPGLSLRASHWNQRAPGTGLRKKSISE